MSFSGRLPESPTLGPEQIGIFLPNEVVTPSPRRCRLPLSVWRTRPDVVAMS
jgi:hypothetical protein